MHTTTSSDISPPAANWRPTIVEGIVIWITILFGFVFLPAGHPLVIGIALSTVLGGPLLPIALWADLRQTQTVSNCPPTLGEYSRNISTDMLGSLLNQTALGTKRASLFDCGSRTPESCGCSD